MSDSECNSLQKYNGLATMLSELGLRPLLQDLSAIHGRLGLVFVLWLQPNALVPKCKFAGKNYHDTSCDVVLLSDCDWCRGAKLGSGLSTRASSGLRHKIGSANAGLHSACCAISLTCSCYFNFHSFWPVAAAARRFLRMSLHSTYVGCAPWTGRRPWVPRVGAHLRWLMEARSSHGWFRPKILLAVQWRQ